jgi:Protein of unknown function (DUF998)
VEQALIGAAGVGLIGAAVFTTDPAAGSPPVAPDAAAQPTRTGMAHTLTAVPLFAGLTAAALTCSWQSFRAGQRGFGWYCAPTATAMLGTMALAGAGFNQSPPAGQSCRIVPAGTHRDRLRLAHRAIRASTHPYACLPGPQTISLNSAHQRARNAADEDVHPEGAAT